MTPPLVHIYLVRHGETDWNAAGRLQGTTDTLLNRRGRAQARRVASALATTPVTRVVTSPLARATETARVVASYSGCAQTMDLRLAEIDHGAWTGRTVAELGATFPGVTTGGDLEPDAFDLGGGERLTAAYVRASGALRSLLDAVADTVVVGHGVTHALLVCAAAGAAARHVRHFALANSTAWRLAFRRRTLVNLERVTLDGHTWNGQVPR